MTTMLLKKIIFIISFVSILILILIGCGRRDVTVRLSVEERFERGMEFFEAGSYTRAIVEFRIIVTEHGGSEYADDAQYYLGESYYRREEYILAANEFNILVITMSGSPRVSDAQYKLAHSYYMLSPPYYQDQIYTIKAIDEFQDFIDFFPLHEQVPDAEVKIRELTEKLARKEYSNGRLYMRLKQYRAATIYFDAVIDRYHDTQYAELAYIGKIESLMKREMYDEAYITVNRFLDRFPESAQRSKANSLLKTINDYR